MKNFFKNQIAIAIIFGALLIALGIIGYGFISKKVDTSQQTLTDIMNSDKIFSGSDFKEKEYILGDKENKITIVVYSDFECPFCKMLQEETIQKLQEKYKTSDKDYSKGKIGIVYRHFAQSYHDKAPTEINASLCARELYGQNVYVNFINRIYSITPANNGLDLSTLPAIAEYAVNESKEKGQDYKKEFDSNEFVTCFTNNTYNEEFMENSTDAINAGLDGTPYTLVLYKDGDKNVILQKISGYKDTTTFERIIEKLLKL